MEENKDAVVDTDTESGRSPRRRRSDEQRSEELSPAQVRAAESTLRVARALSWARFIYPFSFDAEDFDTRVDVINGRLAGGAPVGEGDRNTTGVWAMTGWRQPAKDDAYPGEVGGDLLPHVARFLGEASESPRGSTSPKTAYMWSLKSELFEQYLGDPNRVRWILRLWGGSVPFEVDDIQLALFRHGVGFLTISAKPVETTVREGSVAVWLDFLYGLRFLRGKPFASVRTQSAEKGQITEFGQSPPGLPASWEQSSELFRKLICPLLFTAALDEPVWWEEVFVPGHLIPFAALYVDRKPKNGPVPEEELYDLHYRLRNVISNRQHASLSDVDRSFDHPDLLPFAEHMWFYFSLSAGGFLAYNAPTSGPFRNSLTKKYLKEEYFLAFLVALQQRFVLSVITNKVAEYWLPNTAAARVEVKGWRKQFFERAEGRSSIDESRSVHFDELLQAFLMFSARGYFVQLMQAERHQLYYQKWQDKFQVKQLYEEVRDELNAMHDYLEMGVQERVNYVLNVLTALSIVLGVVGTIAGWWALNFENLSSTFAKWNWPSEMVWLSCLLVVPLVMLGILFFVRMGWFSRRHR